MENDPDNKRELGSGGSFRFLWLFVAFVPSLLTFIIGEHRPPSGEIAGIPVGGFLLIVNGGVSVLAAFRLLGELKSIALRTFLGLLLGFVFFLVNLFVFVLVGCSHANL